MFNLSKSYKPKNFLDLYIPEEVTFENSETVVMPFGYEGTTTFGHGTNNGPKKLIDASWQTELFNEEIQDDIQNKIKIWTSQQPKIPKDPLSACLLLKNIVSQVLELKKFPLGTHITTFSALHSFFN